MANYVDEVLDIAGEEFAHSWLELHPKVYYKKGNAYGLIATYSLGDVTYIASTTRNITDNYTIGMIKDIKTFYNNGSICLISGSPTRHSVLKEAFKRYNFNFKYEGDVMYAFGKGDI